MASSFTINKSIEKPGNGDFVDTWNVPTNADFDIIDQSLGGTTSLNATGGSATLTVSQYRSLIISISGAMSANVIYTIPSGIGGQWIVKNLTTDSVGGPHTVTFASAGGGASYTVPRGTGTGIFADGTNVFSVSPVVGTNNQIIFNSGGVLTGSANLTFNGTAFTSPTDNVLGDTGTTTSISGILNVDADTLYVDPVNNRVGVLTATPSVALDVAGQVNDALGNIRTLAVTAKSADYTLIASDAGTVIAPTTGSITVPNSVFSTGQTITIFNNAGTTRSIVQGVGVTMRLAGTGTTGTRIMDQFGIVTLVCITPSVFVIAGAGLN